MENFLEKIPLDYKIDIEKAVRILKEEGCREVFLFGSLAEGKQTVNSDIDLIDWKKLKELVAPLNETWKQVKDEMEIFLRNSP